MPEVGLRQAVEDLLFAGAYGISELSRGDVIVLIHGIRTPAVWYEPLSAALATIPNVTVVPVRYGYIDLIRFMLPPAFRGNTIAHIRSELGLISRDNRDAQISIIAHSFGTYAVARILETDTALRVRRLVLCGSIIPPRFAWHRIAGQVDEAIVNECATNDIFPILAKLATWGYGPSGTYGFNSTRVIDRFHDLSHSGFFSAGFYSHWWLPLWRDGALPAAPAGDRPTSPSWFRVVASIPFKSLVLVAVLALTLFLTFRR